MTTMLVVDPAVLAGQTLVIKYGGAAMGADQPLREVGLELARLHRAGVRLVVVHGGGPAISRAMEREGLEPRFVRGLRVTCEATMAVTQRVLVGEVNRQVVRHLASIGLSAVGICGQDGGLLQVRPLDPDLGRVGEIVAVDPGLLRTLLEAGFLPVVAPVAADPVGTPYNVNADTVAAALAGALGADRLVLLTDVEGIRADAGDPASRIAECTPAELAALIEAGSLGGGMVPKAEAALAALAAGVPRVDVLDGRDPAYLAEALVAGGRGTTIR